MHRARFSAEAQTAASLRHPNIVQIDEVGEADGQPYLVMEYVEGGTLEQFLNGYRPSPRDSAEFVATLANAVHQAHLQGIIHRDLKPGNILMARLPNASNEPSAQESSEKRLTDWLPKITDFGLAKVLDEEKSLAGPALTMAGDMLGTPSYMAPEQANNDSAGSWTDVYSLGAILYQLLSGRPPFLASTPWETLQQVLDEEVPPLPRSVPVNLRTICMKCLRKQPLDRYTSMSMMAGDLERFLQDKPITARPSTYWERSASWCRRNKTVASLGSVIFVALLTILALAQWSRRELSKSLKETEGARERESVAFKESLENLWASLISEARGQQSSGRVGHRENSLQAVNAAKEMIDKLGRTPERMAELRDTAAACLPLSDLSKIATWNGPRVWNNGGCAADPDMKRVAQITIDGRLVVTENFGAIKVFECLANIADRVILSSDGRWVASFGSVIRLYDLQHTPPLLVMARRSAGWWGFTEASDKLIGSDNLGLFALDLATRKVEGQIPGFFSTVPLAISSDGHRVALVNRETLCVVDLAKSEKICDLEVNEFMPNSHCLAWHPDGERLASGAHADSAIKLWDVAKRKITRRYPFALSFPILAFDHRGQELIVGAAWGGNLGVFDVESEKKLLSYQAPIFGHFTSSENSGVRLWMGTSKDEAHVWEIQTQSIIKSFATENGSNVPRNSAAFSQNGDWMVIATDFGIEVFDCSTMKLIAELPIGRPHFDRVRVDSSNRLWSLLVDGCLSWQVDSTGISAPKFYPISAGTLPIDISHDGEWIMTSDNAGLLRLQSTSQPGRSIQLGHHVDIRNASFSHDSRFVATGGWFGSGAKVWNIADGKEITTLNVGEECDVRFSPDGRWLVSSPRGGEVWDTSTWSLAMQLESPDSSDTGFGFDFSPDSKWLVNSRSNGAIQIWNMLSGEKAGLLQDPYPNRISCLAFTPDQSQLIVVGKDAPTNIKVWDLEQLTSELDSLGLEFPVVNKHWRDPQIRGPKPAALRQSSRLANKSEFKVESNEIYAQHVLKEIEKQSLRELGNNNWRSGLDLLEQACNLCPNDAQVLNNFAWKLLIAPMEFRDAQKSLKFASMAVELDKHPSNFNTLGIAQYRCGEIEAAIVSLKNSLSSLRRKEAQDLYERVYSQVLGNQFGAALETVKESLNGIDDPGATYDLYALASCYAKLGQVETARRYLDLGVAAQAKYSAQYSPAMVRELAIFRADAENLMPAQSLKATPKSNKKDR
ncbi:MAG: protein kinase [Pirellulaceae bacterium]